MLNIIVRNSKKLNAADKRRPGYAYVGRPTVLGNPFSHLNYVKNTVLVANPEEAVKAYETWIRKEIVKGNNQILDALFNLYEVAVSGPLELACWCKDELNPSAAERSRKYGNTVSYYLNLFTVCSDCQVKSWYGR